MPVKHHQAASKVPKGDNLQGSNLALMSLSYTWIIF